ncbi:putative Serine/threonine-protein kinase Nek1 [Paratrimastix pyriformis]|uniref:non-specific serine/threonine protein kinase n=1 Tax=Paratrimastix pyriformis TaxID=342808 RepID=A0ABQ8UU27_9EUKA|nr:putative Serine/threonine-protein kinase Nek1 [Paratrimastix pyriformis]
MDKYEKIRLIGRGSYGAAFLVKRKSDGVQLVAKEITVQGLTPKQCEEALNEVRVLSMLVHPNIVRCYESFIDQLTLVIIMEYADGGDLFSFIRSTRGRPISERQILDWFLQISLAVKHLHDRHILHRDLKTQNVFLTRGRKVVKLGDFGIAKVLGSQTKFAQTSVGTPYYLSPEICEDKPYNEKSDVWSLGCVLYEMATQKHPFDGQNLPALVLKILRGNYPPIPATYSADLSAIINSMLQTDPNQPLPVPPSQPTPAAQCEPPQQPPAPATNVAPLPAPRGPTQALSALDQARAARKRARMGQAGGQASSAAMQDWLSRKEEQERAICDALKAAGGPHSPRPRSQADHVRAPRDPIGPGEMPRPAPRPPPPPAAAGRRGPRRPTRSPTGATTSPPAATSSAPPPFASQLAQIAAVLDSCNQELARHTEMSPLVLPLPPSPSPPHPAAAHPKPASRPAPRRATVGHSLGPTPPPSPGPRALGAAAAGAGPVGRLRAAAQVRRVSLGAAPLRPAAKPSVKPAVAPRRFGGGPAALKGPGRPGTASRMSAASAAAGPEGAADPLTARGPAPAGAVAPPGEDEIGEMERGAATPRLRSAPPSPPAKVRPASTPPALNRAQSRALSPPTSPSASSASPRSPQAMLPPARASALSPPVSSPLSPPMKAAGPHHPPADSPPQPAAGPQPTVDQPRAAAAAGPRHVPAKSVGAFAYPAAAAAAARPHSAPSAAQPPPPTSLGSSPPQQAVRHSLEAPGTPSSSSARPGAKPRNPAAPPRTPGRPPVTPQSRRVLPTDRRRLSTHQPAAPAPASRRRSVGVPAAPAASRPPEAEQERAVSPPASNTTSSASTPGASRAAATRHFPAPNPDERRAHERQYRSHLAQVRARVHGRPFGWQQQQQPQGAADSGPASPPHPEEAITVLVSPTTPAPPAALQPPPPPPPPPPASPPETAGSGSGSEPIARGSGTLLTFSPPTPAPGQAPPAAAAAIMSHLHRHGVPEPLPGCLSAPVPRKPHPPPAPAPSTSQGAEGQPAGEPADEQKSQPPPHGRLEWAKLKQAGRKYPRRFELVLKDLPVTAPSPEAVAAAAGRAEQERRERADRLSTKIETLRNRCDSALGERLFIEVYNYLKDLPPNENDEAVRTRLHGMVGLGQLWAVPLVEQLLCEHLFYGS